MSLCFVPGLLLLTLQRARHTARVAGQHKITDLIRESQAHEHTAIELYKELLEIAAKGESVYLEE